MSFALTGQAMNFFTQELNSSVCIGLGEKCSPLPHSCLPPSQS